MVWKIIVDEKALKTLQKLDKQVATRIVDFIENRLAIAENPRLLGSALQGSELGDFWKYRVGDYRVIASIYDVEITISIVKIGNRKDVYR
jgi:mRNA interferase RelE/StbE